MVAPSLEIVDLPTKQVINKFNDNQFPYKLIFNFKTNRTIY